MKIESLYFNVRSDNLNPGVVNSRDSNFRGKNASVKSSINLNDSFITEKLTKIR